MNKHVRCLKREHRKKEKEKQPKQHKKRQELPRCQLDGELSSVSEISPILPDVPEEIVHDILSRVPVKSLMRFKCACKRWQSIIQKDDFFANLHLCRSKTTHRSISRVRIGRLNDPLPNNIDQCMLSMELIFPSEDSEDNGTVGAMSLWKNPFPDNCVLCSTNGLLCVMDNNNHRACVYNISTRESTPWIKSTFIKEQEEDKNQKLYCTDILLEGFGLGYDPVTKEHKVIALWRYNATNQQVCEVLTLRHNRWRRIDAAIPPLSEICCHYGYEEPVHVNGLICWLHVHHRYCEEPCFMQFDVGGETFKKINIVLPNTFKVSSTSLSLIDIDGELAILAKGGTSTKMYLFCEQGKESKTATCNYTWMEETLSNPFFDFDWWIPTIQHIPGTDFFMVTSTYDDNQSYYFNWKKKSYSSCKINSENSLSLGYYNWKKKSYISRKINFASFRGFRDVIFTPNLFPVN